MHKFYEELVGLEVAATGGSARRDESFVFFNKRTQVKSEHDITWYWRIRCLIHNSIADWEYEAGLFV